MDYFNHFKSDAKSIGFNSHTLITGVLKKKGGKT
jgi:hypothetical protein